MNTEISIEFFPPQTPEGVEKLRAVRAELAKLQPEFFSVTYGAGGSTRERTFAVVKEIAAEGFDAAPHLSCIGSSRESIREILAEYKAAGIKRTVALRGDLPSGMARSGDLRYASELVRLIRDEHGDHFHVEVAAYPETHPQAEDAGIGLGHFKTKVDAGASGAITQYFYNADAYFRFVDDARAQGIDLPIVPGIMPIANFSQLRRFSEACGAQIPRWIDQRMRAFGDDAGAVREFASDVVAGLCRRLAEGGAPALHFYTLNLAKPTQAVLQRLS